MPCLSRVYTLRTLEDPRNRIPKMNYHPTMFLFKMNNISQYLVSLFTILTQRARHNYERKVECRIVKI